MIVHFLFKLVACKNYFAGVDYDYVIAAVSVRSKCRLVLAAKKRSSLRSNGTEGFAVSIKNIPITADVGSLRHIS